MTARDLDLLVLGATGFTGRQVAHRLAAHPEAAGLRWALAGRRPEALAAVRDALGPAHAGLPLLTVDTLDPASIGPAVARARVVLSTVGPYARYGDAVVDACAAHGTHYCDITGETAWVSRVIARHHEACAARGTRLVPFCGFDSVPAELGVALLTDALGADGQGPPVDIVAAYRARGGFNGGTLASALHLFGHESLRAAADPFSLLPPGPRPPRGPHRDDFTPFTVPHLGGWLAPFFMSPVNARVVRRSHALRAAAAGTPDAPLFTYREGTPAGGLPGAWAATAAMGTFTALATTAPGRSLLAALGPAPGQGPAEATLDAGWFVADFAAEADGGARAFAQVAMRGDPGNRVTVACLVECALALVCDADALPLPGGVLTPGAAFGPHLARRLAARGMVLRTGDARLPFPAEVRAPGPPAGPAGYGLGASGSGDGGSPPP
jgi:short subunit dehydrogenase-like uncharacterized protein